MIRSSAHRLYGTQMKTDSLESVFIEYTSLVNQYIKLLWDSEKVFGSFVPKELQSQCVTWLSARMQQAAGKQAVAIVKSTHKKDAELRYTQYKRVFAKAKSKAKDWEIVNLKYSDWVKGKVFRKRISMPIFEGAIDLDSRFVTIETSNNSFDFWVKLSSIGRKVQLLIPTKAHKHFNELKSNGFQLKQSIRVRKYKNQFFIDMIHEKDTQPVLPKGKQLGIDLGINKLISTSQSTVHGTEFRKILNVLKRKQRNSMKWKRVVTRLKNYIGQTVNQIDFSQFDTCVVEDLTGISKDTRKRMSKEGRRLMSNWNFRLISNKIKQRCEENRVFFTTVNPAYTSQTCNVCGHVDRSSRFKEVFNCTSCKYTVDADINGAINILHRFLNE